MKTLLLAGAMTLAITGTTFANDDNLYETDDSSIGVCVGDYCSTDEALVSDDLTLEERKQLTDLKAQKARIELKMAQIIAHAGARMEHKLALEKAKKAEAAERERVRISQCTVPTLKIGCPPK